jgi:hypothetical protein
MSDFHKMTRKQLSLAEEVLLDFLRQISVLTTGREEAEQRVFSHFPEWFVDDLKQVRMHDSSISPCA